MRSSGRELVQLQWEGAAGRQPESKLVVQVRERKEGAPGTLGQLGNHPSLARSVPSPVDIQAAVLAHTGSWSAPNVALRYPKYKLPDAALNERLALGVLGQNVCICLARVPGDVADAALPEWLAHWQCEP
jgi:hypothetical protein